MLKKPKFIGFFGFLHNYSKHKLNKLMYVHVYNQSITYSLLGLHM